MSQPEPDDTAEEEPEIDLADPDDYHRKQRLKEIHKARQRVHKAIEQAEHSKKRKVNRAQRRDLAYAVSMYVSELEPIIRDTDADVTLPDKYPFDNVLQYADALGTIPKDVDLPDGNELRYTPKPNSIQVYRICNHVLADVKPLITEDETDEWEV
jgi:hypothetical protein